MANIKACFSSKSNEWATPADLFKALDEEFHFNLDPCCTHENAKCERHFTIAENGLIQDWGGQKSSAILHTELTSSTGSRNATKRAGSPILWSSCSFRRGPIRNTFTNTYTIRRGRYASSKEGFTLMTLLKEHHFLQW